MYKHCGFKNSYVGNIRTNSLPQFIGDFPFNGSGLHPVEQINGTVKCFTPEI
jgi:hypothetical protein